VPSEATLVALLGPVITAFVGAFGLWAATKIKRGFKLADQREQEKDRYEQIELERDRAIEYSRRLRQRLMMLPFVKEKEPEKFEIRLEDLVNEARDETAFTNFVQRGEIWNQPLVQKQPDDDLKQLGASEDEDG
jgi:hypothetical protein